VTLLKPAPSIFDLACPSVKLLCPATGAPELFHKFKDKYESALKALVKRKAAGKTIEVPEEEEESNVIDLMDALKQSLGRKKAATSPAKGRKRGTIHRGRKRRAA
jgi:non-homologous end joining protein Ku